jgi:hypothetical protein
MPKQQTFEVISTWEPEDAGVYRSQSFPKVDSHSIWPVAIRGREEREHSKV